MDDLLRQDPATTRALVAALGRVPALRDREHDLGHRGAQPGSVAESTLKHPSGRYAEIFASHLIGVAGDNLLTWHAVLMSGVQPGFGHLTLIRASIEGSVEARWLLDPNASLATRVARGLAAQRADYEERAKWERTIPGGVKAPPPFKPALLRISLQSDHSFRSNPITRFGGFRSPAREAVSALT